MGLEERGVGLEASLERGEGLVRLERGELENMVGRERGERRVRSGGGLREEGGCKISNGME